MEEINNDLNVEEFNDGFLILVIRECILRYQMQKDEIIEQLIKQMGIELERANRLTERVINREREASLERKKAEEEERKSKQEKNYRTFEKMQMRYRRLYEAPPEEDKSDKISDLPELRKQLAEAKGRRDRNGRRLGYLAVATLQSRIERLENLQKKEERRTALYSATQQVINELFSGTLTNVEEAKQVFLPLIKTNSSLSSEKQFQVIFTEFQSLLEEKALELDVPDPQRIIVQMSQLTGQDEVKCAHTILNMLITREEYEKARTVLSAYKEESRQKSIWLGVNEDQLDNMEFGKSLAEALRADSIGKGEIQKIFKRLNPIVEKLYLSKRVRDLTHIPLGTNRSGTRKITLEQIYPRQRIIVEE